jgi:uncharacterized protein (TIGR02444 family)
MGSLFWNFSIAVYRSSEVQDECLRLQDEFRLDVNLILLCAFLGAVHGVALSAGDIASARQEIGQWHEDIVRPLRSARRALKTIDVADAEAAMELRTQVKAAELEAERIEQMTLQRWADARLKTWPRAKPADAALDNLQALLSAYGIGAERLDAAQAMPHLIAAALDRKAK